MKGKVQIYTHKLEGWGFFFHKEMYMAMECLQKDNFGIVLVCYDTFPLENMNTSLC